MAGLASAAPGFQNADGSQCAALKKEKLSSGEFFTSEMFAVGGKGGEVSIGRFSECVGSVNPKFALDYWHGVLSHAGNS